MSISMAQQCRQSSVGQLQDLVSTLARRPMLLWMGIPQPLGCVTATTTAHKAGGEPMNKMINICDETGCWRGERGGGISQLFNY